MWCSHSFFEAFRSYDLWFNRLSMSDIFGHLLLLLKRVRHSSVCWYVCRMTEHEIRSLWTLNKYKVDWYEGFQVCPSGGNWKDPWRDVCHSPFFGRLCGVTVPPRDTNGGKLRAINWWRLYIENWNAHGALTDCPMANEVSIREENEEWVFVVRT